MKISANYWETLKPFEKEYFRERQDLETVPDIKAKIKVARKMYPDYCKIYGKGFIILQDGQKYLWSGRDTKTYKPVTEEQFFTT